MGSQSVGHDCSNGAGHTAHAIARWDFFKNKFIYSFTAGCAGSLLLPGLFSSCGDQELLSSCSTWASFCGGLSHCRAPSLRHAGSIVVAPGLLSNRCNSFSTRA